MVTGTECRKQPGVVVAVGGGDIIVFSPSSFKLEIVTRPLSSEYTNPDSDFPLSFTVAVTLVSKKPAQ